jgi:hypothetical protein
MMSSPLLHFLVISAQYRGLAIAGHLGIAGLWQVSAFFGSFKNISQTW